MQESDFYLPVRRLREFLDHLTRIFDLQVCIKSFLPFISLDRRLARSLYDYHTHRIPYCLLIKSDRSLLRRCNRSVNHIEKKCCESPGGFFGTCHAGVTEYILPLHDGRAPFGYISIGGFRADSRMAARRLRTARSRCGLDLELMRRMYNQHMKRYSPEMHSAIYPNLGIIAEYLEHIYGRIRPAEGGDGDSESTARAEHHRENNLLSRMLQYINDNYTERITVQALAEECCCSRSSITHVFKKNMGMSIRSYVNHVRVGKAQRYLRVSDSTVTEIALSVGYQDPNYFSKVFSDIRGLSPLAYRRTMRGVAVVE